MKRIVMLLLVASLVPGPVMAATAAQEAGRAQETVATEPAVPAAPATDEADGKLLETIAIAAKEIAAEDVAALGVGNRAVVQDEDGVATWKMVVGVGLLAGGAGLIANGIALRQEEPDPFGRVKDADSWVAIGVGASFMTIGAFVVRDALGGNEF